jgi:nitrogen fixation/metabolism regulation signal transduction histidine kinase
VAHEIKNPLAPIRAAVETLRRLRARQDPEFDAYFDQATRIVLDEVHRISNIVTEFTRFARLAPPQPVDTDLVDLARQVIALHEANDSGAHLTLEVDTATRAVPLVRADRDQILRVLTNLVQNALYAVASRGKAGEVRLSIAAENGSRVAVTVADNGPGLAPEIASRLFEPYATDKPNGTGLGLAIAQRIAIEHDGELAYVAPAGGQRDGERGATFRLVLPVDGPPPPSENGPA